MEASTRVLGKCLKNHAVGSGGHALDGCGEFMQTLSSSSSDESALICEVCGCHRNYHYQSQSPVAAERRNYHYQSQSPVAAERVDVIENPHPPTTPTPTPTLTPAPSPFVAVANSNGILNSPSPAPISSSYYPLPPHIFFAFNPAAASFPAPEPVDINRQPTLATGSNGVRKRRFRTKFTQEQKARMQEFAERLGWKMPKKEDGTVVAFCNDIGVEKLVFKVWMHNHKNIHNARDNNNGNGNGNDQSHRDNGAKGNGANGSSSSC